MLAVSCVAVHPFRPRILLGFDNGVIQEKEISVLGSETCCDRQGVLAGWDSEGIDFVCYLSSHESCSFPASLASCSGKAASSLAGPSPVIAQDMALALSGACCSLVDLSVQSIVARWCLPFTPHSVSVCGPIVMLGPYHWSKLGNAPGSLVGDLVKDWNSRHALLLDVSSYRAGVTEPLALQSLCKERTHIYQQFSQNRMMMEPHSYDHLFASCGQLVSTPDKSLQTLLQLEGHQMSPFIAATYSPLPWEILSDKFRQRSAAAASESAAAAFDAEVSQMLHIEVIRLSPQGRPTPCCSALRVCELFQLFGVTNAVFIGARFVGFRPTQLDAGGNECFAPQLVVALSCGLVVVTAEPCNSAANSGGNGAVAAPSSVPLPRNLVRWVPQQMYCLSSFKNPIAVISKPQVGLTVQLMHKNGLVIELDIQEAFHSESDQAASVRPRTLYPKPLSTCSMWRVPSTTIAAECSPKILRYPSLATFYSAGRQTSLVGYDVPLRRITVAPLNYCQPTPPRFAAAGGTSPHHCRTTFPRQFPSSAAAGAWPSFLVSADISSGFAGGKYAHECIIELHRSSSISSSYVYRLPQVDDVASIHLQGVWAAMPNENQLDVVMRVDYFGTDPASRGCLQLGGAPQPRGTLLFVCLRMEGSTPGPSKRFVVDPSCGHTLRLCSEETIQSVAVCSVTNIVWVLVEASNRMVVRSCNPREFVERQKAATASSSCWISEFHVSPSVTEIVTPSLGDAAGSPLDNSSRNTGVYQPLIILVHRRLGNIDVMSSSDGRMVLHYSIPRRSHCGDAIWGPVACRQYLGLSEVPSSVNPSEGVDQSLFIITTQVSSASSLRLQSTEKKKRKAEMDCDLRVHTALAVRNSKDMSWQLGRPAKDAWLFPWKPSISPLIFWGPTTNTILVTELLHQQNLGRNWWLVETSFGLSTALPISNSLKTPPISTVEFLQVDWQCDLNEGDGHHGIVTMVAFHQSTNCADLPSRYNISTCADCLYDLRVPLAQMRLQAALLCAMSPTPIILRHPQLFVAASNEADPVGAVKALLDRCGHETSLQVLSASSTLSVFGLCGRWLLNMCTMSLNNSVSKTVSPSRWWDDAWRVGSGGVLFHLLRAMSVGEHDADTIALVTAFMGGNQRCVRTCGSFRACVLAEWICCVKVQWWGDSLCLNAQEWLNASNIPTSSAGGASADIIRFVLNCVELTPALAESLVVSSSASKQLYGVSSQILVANVEYLMPFAVSGGQPSASSLALDALQRFRHTLDQLVPNVTSVAVVQTSQPQESQLECVQRATTRQEIHLLFEEAVVAGLMWSWALRAGPNKLNEGVPACSNDSESAVQPVTTEQQAALRRQFQAGSTFHADDDIDRDPDLVDNGRYGVIDVKGAIVLKQMVKKNADDDSGPNPHVNMEAIPEPSEEPSIRIYPKNQHKAKVGVGVSRSFEPLFESLEAAPHRKQPTVVSSPRADGNSARPQSSSRRVQEKAPAEPVAKTSSRSNHAHLSEASTDEMVDRAMAALEMRNFKSALNLFRGVEKSSGGASDDMKRQCHAYRKICKSLISISRQGEQLHPQHVVNERDAHLLAAALVLPDANIRPFHLLIVSLPLLEFCVEHHFWEAAHHTSVYVRYLMNTACMDSRWEHMYLLWAHEQEGLIGNLTSLCQAVDDYCEQLGSGEPPKDQQSCALVQILLGETPIESTSGLFDLSD